MRPLFIRVLCLAGVLAAGLIRPQESQGQAFGGAAVLQIEPSVRASGMGRASGAVFWGWARIPGPTPHFWDMSGGAGSRTRGSSSCPAWPPISPTPPIR
jgi:hypothetical protein